MVAQSVVSLTLREALKGDKPFFAWVKKTRLVFHASLRQNGERGASSQTFCKLSVEALAPSGKSMRMLLRTSFVRILSPRARLSSPAPGVRPQLADDPPAAMI